MRLGTLTLTGSDDAVTGIAWTPWATDASPNPRLARFNPDRKPIAFGPVTTNGACRIARDDAAVTVRPLPESNEFVVRLDWTRLPWVTPAPSQAQAIGRDGAVLSTDPITIKSGVVTLTCRNDVFEYRLLP